MNLEADVTALQSQCRLTLEQSFSPQLSRLSLLSDDADLCIWMGRDELKTARDIQERLLPVRCPQPQGFHIEACQKPALQVGGDHYNFHVVGRGQLGIVIADVSGKGIKAALVAALFASTFRVQSWGNHDVRDVLARVNDFIVHALQAGMFVTCLYGLLDVNTRSFTFGRAGHEPLLVLRADGSLETHAPRGFALGLLDNATFKQMTEIHTVQLRSGDRMLLFTDGLTEAMNSDGEEFGQAQIEETLRFSQHSPQTIPVFERVVLTHMGEALPHDDLTIISLSVY